MIQDLIDLLGTMLIIMAPYGLYRICVDLLQFLNN
jgi:hypothetical protein